MIMGWSWVFNEWAWVSFNIKVLSELKIKVTFASCIEGLELKKNFN